MNDAIKEMLKTPGIYQVSAWGMLPRYMRAEVDEQGIAYQLTPEGKRDGVLEEAGWGDAAMVLRKEES